MPHNPQTLTRSGKPSCKTPEIAARKYSQKKKAEFRELELAARHATTTTTTITMHFVFRLQSPGTLPPPVAAARSVATAAAGCAR